MTRAEQHAAYLRSLADPLRMEAVKQVAEQINKAWRERTPKQRAMRCKSDIQFDSEREAEQSGITMARYLREY